MRYIGIDLHSTQLTVCYRDISGKEQFEEVKIDLVAKFVNKLSPDDKVAFEATGNSIFLQNQLLKKLPAENVIVVNTLQFKLISKSVKKTDKNDSQLLALYLSKEMLPEARLRNEQESMVLNLLETRDMIVTTATAFKNQIHNLLLKLGIKLKSSELSSRKRLNNLVEKLALEGIYKFQVELAIRNIIHAWEEADVIEAKLEELKPDIGQIENLASISGIATKSAMAVKAVMGDVENYAAPDKLVAFMGLCPRVNNSNETVNHGRITKRGNKLVRKLLVQCAWVSIRYNPIMKEYYNKLKKHKPAGKAIIAVARKLVYQIYYTLKYNWYFLDTANTQKVIKIF